MILFVTAVFQIIQSIRMAWKWEGRHYCLSSYNTSFTIRRYAKETDKSF